MLRKKQCLPRAKYSLRYMNFPIVSTTVNRVFATHSCRPFAPVWMEIRYEFQMRKKIHYSKHTLYSVD